MERSFCRNGPFCRGNPRKFHSQSSSRILKRVLRDLFYLVKSQMSTFWAQIELLQIILKILDVDRIPTNAFFILLNKEVNCEKEHFYSICLGGLFAQLGSHFAKLKCEIF